MATELPIIDLHHCIQGEGMSMGIPHILIRLTGCNLRCSFGRNICDTPYSSWNAEHGVFTDQDLKTILYQSSERIHWVLITGGEPMMNPSTLALIIALSKSFGYKVAIETNGTIFLPGFRFDLVTLSPKLKNSIPSDIEVSEALRLSHIQKRYQPGVLRAWMDNFPYQFKFVITRLLDMREIQNDYLVPLSIPREKVWLMPEGMTATQLEKRRKMVMNLCLSQGLNYSDRLHILAFGNKRGI